MGITFAVKDLKSWSNDEFDFIHNYIENLMIGNSSLKPYLRQKSFVTAIRKHITRPKCGLKSKFEELETEYQNDVRKDIERRKEAKKKRKLLSDTDPGKPERTSSVGGDLAADHMSLGSHGPEASVPDTTFCSGQSIAAPESAEEETSIARHQLQVQPCLQQSAVDEIHTKKDERKDSHAASHCGRKRAIDDSETRDENIYAVTQPSQKRLRPGVVGEANALVADDMGESYHHYPTDGEHYTGPSSNIQANQQAHSRMDLRQNYHAQDQVPTVEDTVGYPQMHRAGKFRLILDYKITRLIDCNTPDPQCLTVSPSVSQGTANLSNLLQMY
ncbi:hypothetical protein FLAG1_11682 [Fusarium langsethiae]|uniref:Uncharacterized protein n=1 Tax=Fusarium langsethiae TaxID=179993 RepID=A0A0M9EM74_FUSLA|nr:hypothetical protein FLAG1_11682 [Fusarium langsethiae]